MPGREGVYKVLDNDFTATDDAFETCYEAALRQWKAAAPAARKAGKPPESVMVAVADSGFFTTHQYFQARLGESADFTQGYTLPRLTRGQPATTGTHGSHVASIAGFGTTRIKLIDAQICSSQETGQNNATVWASALNWAASQRPAVINCSVNVPWHEDAVQAVVSRNTGVLFVATAGNTDTEYGAAYRSAGGSSFSSGNTILVSGCGADGGRIPNRGFGSGVDIYAPSVNIPGLAATELQRQKFNFDQARKREERQLDQQSAAEKNRQALETARQELAGATGMAAQFIQRKIRNLEAARGLPDYVPPPFAPTALSDSGSSFALPMVANVAAKMVLINPGLTPAQVIDLLTRNAEANATLSVRAGSGIMDPVRAYQAALASRGGT